MDFNKVVGYKNALIYESTVQPENYPKLHHGYGYVNNIDIIIKEGLPKKGVNLDLIQHAEPESGYIESAFRGSSKLTDPAVNFAGDGGFVFKIKGWKCYDLNKLLEGKIRTSTGFRNLKMTAEQEIAIPAEVPAEFIKGYAKVSMSPNVPRLKLNWIKCYE